ncbi:ferredoxin-type protein NapF [Paraferrimonas sp. SM1919]|uniref:ferredoxin-type protein NapF n=1 Tax=Paraferrimonas sp. SM1919 TaxID=2662263 RepID=UPI0013D0BD94|nr:ferredoxin-type protein NapF [Paraferrimonas sp. SM1919]
MELSKRKLFSPKATETNVSLPWIKNLDNFCSQCSQCGECISACPQNIIVKGDGGFPSIDFRLGECDFCYKCAGACPDNLFNPQDSSPWQQKASINKLCLLENGVECRSCGDSCPEMAITFKLQIGRPAKAEINQQACSGCGACVADCPTSAVEIIQL